MADTVSSGGRSLNEIGVVEVVSGIKEGRFSAVDVVGACLDRVSARDAGIGAWVQVDRDGALSQARKAPGGVLGGVPFGVKDVIDTADLPTQMGSSLYRGYAPRFDAGCVGLMRLAGAIVLGKTATCEFAGTAPAATTNPLDPLRTPGGSSSGSAAAVADMMVPFAFGTQTGGSVLRPAAFCGIVGFKPSYGFYPVSGMKEAAHSFDTVGTFARSVEDVAFVHAVLMNLEGKALAPAVKAPRIGILRTHLWDTLDEVSASAFDASVAALALAGAQLSEVEPPAGFERITQRRAVINAFERARDLAGEWLSEEAMMEPLTAEVVRRGFAVDGESYAAARADVEMFRASAVNMLADVDVLLTPVTPGEAPVGLGKTGDPRFQELWTMLQMPAISLPAGKGSAGLPLAVQVVGSRFEDASLLAAAGWIEGRLREG